MEQARAAATKFVLRRDAAAAGDGRVGGAAVAESGSKDGWEGFLLDCIRLWHQARAPCGLIVGPDTAADGMYVLTETGCEAVVPISESAEALASFAGGSSMVVPDQSGLADAAALSEGLTALRSEIATATVWEMVESPLPYTERQTAALLAANIPLRTLLTNKLLSIQKLPEAVEGFLLRLEADSKSCPTAAAGGGGMDVGADGGGGSGGGGAAVSLLHLSQLGAVRVRAMVASVVQARAEGYRVLLYFLAAAMLLRTEVVSLERSLQGLLRHRAAAVKEFRKFHALQTTLFAHNHACLQVLVQHWAHPGSEHVTVDEAQWRLLNDPTYLPTELLMMCDMRWQPGGGGGGGGGGAKDKDTNKREDKNKSWWTMILGLAKNYIALADQGGEGPMAYLLGRAHLLSSEFEKAKVCFLAASAALDDAALQQIFKAYRLQDKLQNAKQQTSVARFFLHVASEFDRKVPSKVTDRLIVPQMVIDVATYALEALRGVDAGSTGAAAAAAYQMQTADDGEAGEGGAGAGGEEEQAEFVEARQYIFEYAKRLNQYDSAFAQVVSLPNSGDRTQTTKRRLLWQLVKDLCREGKQQLLDSGGGTAAGGGGAGAAAGGGALRRAVKAAAAGKSKFQIVVENSYVGSGLEEEVCQVLLSEADFTDVEEQYRGPSSGAEGWGVGAGRAGGDGSAAGRSLESPPNFYEILFAFHTRRGNFRKAAAAMFKLARRIREDVLKPMPRLDEGGGGKARVFLRHGIDALSAAMASLQLVSQEYWWLAEPKLAGHGRGHGGGGVGAAGVGAAAAAVAKKPNALVQLEEIECESLAWRCELLLLETEGAEPASRPSRGTLRARAGLSYFDQPDSTVHRLCQAKHYSRAILLAIRAGGLGQFAALERTVGLVHSPLDRVFETVAKDWVAATAAAAQHAVAAAGAAGGEGAAAVRDAAADAKAEADWAGKLERLLEQRLVGKRRCDTADTNYRYHTVVAETILRFGYGLVCASCSSLLPDGGAQASYSLSPCSHVVCKGCRDTRLDGREAEVAGAGIDCPVGGCGCECTYIEPRTGGGGVGSGGGATTLPGWLERSFEAKNAGALITLYLDYGDVTKAVAVFSRIAADAAIPLRALDRLAAALSTRVGADYDAFKKAATRHPAIDETGL
jgi:hypothetical protein